jgi:dihydroorotase
MIKTSGITGGNLKSYCKTRWTTSSESVNSIIKLQPVLEDVSNIKIITLINFILFKLIIY